MADKIFPLSMYPGIQRDGTTFSSRYYTDGSWCRFYKGLPRKMGGYVQIVGGLPNIVRGIQLVNNAPNFNVYYGDQSTLKYVPINGDGVPLGPSIDRTPPLFAADANNDWQFDAMFTNLSGGTMIAFAAPNLFAIDSTVERPIYYGEQLSNDPLLPTGFQCSGGVVVLGSLLFFYGNNGNISWTQENQPTVLLNSVNIENSKIVYGLPTRGGNSSPAGLFWSLDSLIRVTNSGATAADFSFDTVTSESSILSSNGVVQYDNEYYWAGIDRFLMYNGIVQEVKNNLSLEYFYSNVNFAQRQKVFATKIPKWGEIWWFFPTGNNTECNHAVVYNIRENSWYDTPVFRSDAEFDQTFAFPVWADNDSPGNFNLWMHENGLDKVEGNTVTPIDSFCTTGDIAWCATGPDGQRNSLDKSIYLYRIEPDFFQAPGANSNMTVTVSGRQYANSPLVTNHAPYAFNDTTNKIDMREQYREMVLTFESNVQGGDYFMGQTLLVGRVGDERPAP